MYQLVFNDDAAGTADADAIAFPEVLQNVNWQIDPGANDAWDVKIKARLDASLSWETIKEVKSTDDPVTKLFETPAYPFMQVELVSVTGPDSGAAVAVKVGMSYSPDDDSVMTNTTPASELAAIT